MKSHLASILDAIEQERGSKAIVFAASNLDIGLLPTLYDLIEELSPKSSLDVVIHCHGGEITAARRLARILTDATRHLTFIVPFYCTSAGTIMTLAADEIIAGATAVFSPVDPQLTTAPDSANAGESMISAEDVRLLRRAYADWFNVDQNQANEKALAKLSDNIFPTTLTSFYRATKEVKMICSELLSIREGRFNESEIDQIITSLSSGYHSHFYPISGEDLSALSLPVIRSPRIEKAAWKASKFIRSVVGGGLRKAPKDDWVDAMIASRERVFVRRNTQQRLEAIWEELDT
ncbi:MAG: hypothetical protein GXP04_10155 [Alphaproteobacteria bacterium]|nr:hypothetical protein [Alphaproteobacteria bacterium]